MAHLDPVRFNNRFRTLAPLLDEIDWAAIGLPSFPFVRLFLLSFFFGLFENQICDDLAQFRVRHRGNSITPRRRCRGPF